MSESTPIHNESVDAIVGQALRGDVPRRDFLRRLVVAGMSSAAAYQLVSETTASAQTGGKPQITTFAIGEEGGSPQSVPGDSPNSQITTHAVGEESSKPPRTAPQNVTTHAMGEESIRPQTTLSYGLGEEGYRPTTQAVGEESINRPTPTTLAVGEEGQPGRNPVTEKPPYVPTKAVGEESTNRPRPTTMALGEEGNPQWIPNPGTNPKVTTQALGEEGNPQWIPKPRTNPKVTTQAVGEEGSSTTPSFKVPSRLFENIPRPWKNFRRW